MTPGTATPTHAQIYDRFMAGESIHALGLRYGTEASAVERGIRARMVELQRLRDPARLAANERAYLAQRAVKLAADAIAAAECAGTIGPQTRPETRARWIAFAALETLGWSQSAVAKGLGVDHTTVMYARGRMPDELDPIVETVTAALRRPA